MDTSTIEYYNCNAKNFTDDTRDVDFHTMQDKFLAMLPDNAHILDLGCGAGRDTKYFLDMGYVVSAIDGSEQLCKLASEYTGIQVKQMLFQELEEEHTYDGIWACASLLHTRMEEFPDILSKVSKALKQNGILYLSFKYGEFEGVRNGRYFLDMTEKRFAAMSVGIPDLHIIWQDISTDIRPDRDEKWLNIILKKEA